MFGTCRDNAQKMDGIDKRTRLVIALCLSLMVHWLLFAYMPWRGLRALNNLNQEKKSGTALTVTLNNAQVSTSAAKSGVSISEKSRIPPEGHWQAKVDTRSADTTLPDSMPGKVIFETPPELEGHPENAKVVIRLWISKTGMVVKVEPVTAELSQTFIASARKRYMNTKFLSRRNVAGGITSYADITLIYGKQD